MGEDAKLTGIEVTTSKFRRNVQLDFDNDRHYEIISVLNGADAREIGNMMIRHGKELIRLSNKENWNE